MEYKKCEHCGELIHIRSKKCPFCNEIVEEVPKEIIQDNLEQEKTESTDTAADSFPGEKNEKANEEASETNSNNSQQPGFNFVVGQDEPKDYVYKAEVRHSLEYVEPMSNWAKVFISALCTLPLIGQLLGSFLGVFFTTYEDVDRKSFGKALILLSIIMFIIYSAYVSQLVTLMQGMDIEGLYNSLLQQS